MISTMIQQQQVHRDPFMGQAYHFSSIPTLKFVAEIKEIFNFTSRSGKKVKKIPESYTLVPAVTISQFWNLFSESM